MNSVGRPSSGIWDLLGLGIGFVLLLLAPSADSFWIDEANSAVIALQGDLAHWWRQVAAIGSDVQMSPYFLQLWAWAKYTDGSEWSLRLNNYPWLLLGIGSWFLVLPHRVRAGFALLAGLSPFLFYYANELRPYSMLFGASSLMFAALYGCLAIGVSQGRLFGFGCGCLLSICASASALPWVATACIVCGVVCCKAKPSWKTLLVLMPMAVAALGLGLFYLWSFSKGNRASSPEASSPMSLLFIAYELLGFVGLGPGRMALRSSGADALRNYLPVLWLHFLGIAVVITAGLTALKRRIGGRNLVLSILGFLIPLLAVILLGYFAGLRTTGRHVTPALALILPTAALGLHLLWRNRLLRWFALLLIGCLAVSCFQVRIAPEHKKDDYREAARIAKAELARGRPVWWVADRRGAEYYRLPVSEREQGAALHLFNPTKVPDALPELVVLNRPDAYDNSGMVQRMLLAHGYLRTCSPHGFSVWRKP